MDAVRRDVASNSLNASLLALVLAGCGLVDTRLQAHQDAVRAILSNSAISHVDEDVEGAPALGSISEHTPPPFTEEDISALTEEFKNISEEIQKNP